MTERPEFFPTQCSNAHNFVFLGEAGSGKSEIAVNLAISLAARREKEVHFFDLDMTKPLFRSRDLADRMTEAGVMVHFEEQFYDAPTAAGGVDRMLRSEDCYTILDVGGDYFGARSVGGYAPWLNREGTVVWYVINTYRPWSMDIDHIDKILGQILGVSRVRLDRVHIVGNPNVGPDTTAGEVILGARQLEEMVGPYKPIDFYTVQERLFPETEGKVPGSVFPIRLYLTYEWVQES